MHSAPIGTIYILKRAELAVRACMEVALSEFGLTPAQFLMLFRLRSSKELSVADLARDIGVRPQSIIQIIGPLERRHLLKREPRPGHRRILGTQLTAAGRELLEDALLVAVRVETELLAGVGSDQLSMLQGSLASLLDRAEKHDLHPNSMRARAVALMPERSTHRRGE